MPEREYPFTDREKAEIAEVALGVARVGEDFVWELVFENNRLMKLALANGDNGVVVGNVYYSPSQIIHKIELISEVVGQARIILQIQGRDLMSELDRRTQAGGMGSVFDPESEISSRLKDVYGR